MLFSQQLTFCCYCICHYDGSILIRRLCFFFRFTLIKEHLIEFNQLAMANSSGSDDMLNRVMPRDNIGLAALLKTKETAWENCKSFRNVKYIYFFILSLQFFFATIVHGREKKIIFVLYYAKAMI